VARLPQSSFHHTASIHWGDGQVTEALVDQTARTFLGTHSYTAEGIFEVGVTLTDDDGGEATATLPCYVTGQRLTPDGILQIVGTSLYDKITVSQNRNQVTVSIKAPGFSQNLRYPASAIAEIVVIASGGDDLVRIDSLIRASIFGGEGADSLSGGGGDDLLDGGDGRDYLFGGAGNDVLLGGQGCDLLFGQWGDDLLRGDEGDDWLFGGDGNDDLDGGLGDDYLFADLG